MGILGMTDEQFNGLDAAPTLHDVTAQAYPFIKQHNMVVVNNPQEGRGYAETWPANEPGDVNYPRPKSIPMDRHGVEVFAPGAFGPHDLAGEAMHVDPFVNKSRDDLSSSLTPAQVKALRAESRDYDVSIGQYHMSHEAALRNATDSLIRGHAVGQWPAEAVGRIGLDKKQMETLEGIRRYVTGAEK